MITISRDYDFSAAHLLPNHKGKCRFLHGHNYHLVVTVQATGLAVSGSEEGMVMDFAALDEIVKPVIELLDHKFIAMGDEWPYLTETAYQGRAIEFAVIGLRTTAENLAVWIGTKIDHELEPPVSLYSIELWETKRNCATWRPK